MDRRMENYMGWKGSIFQGRGYIAVDVSVKGRERFLLPVTISSDPPFHTKRVFHHTRNKAHT